MIVEQAIQLGWQAQPIELGGEPVAYVLTRGSEVHVLVLPEFAGHAIPRRQVIALLTPVLAEHGYLTTRVPLGVASICRFVERVGFEPTWSDEHFHYFMLTAAPFAK